MGWIALPDLLGHSDLVGEFFHYGLPCYVWITFYETFGMDGNTPGQILPVNYRLLQVFNQLLELRVVPFLL